ncbi:MAG: hypothetical protein RDV48_09745 [Candidatus Eremiobacteraeota bacterium]|nr:hypothetical protein [Candidatus Eremiobacteraeota bacterium]
MRRFQQAAFSALIAILIVCMPAMADVRIGQVKLSSKKINLVKFGIMNISGDGKIVTCYEKVSDLKLKQKGFVFKLWIFEFMGETRDDVKISEVLLPLTEFQTMALSDDGRTGIITGNRGAKFLKVDIPSRTVTVLFDHKKGAPGFRSDEGILNYLQEKFLSWGYFYNNEDLVTKRAIAMIDPAKTGADVFQPAFDTGPFEKRYYNSRYIEWVSKNQCFVIGRKKGAKEQTLAFYDNGTLKELEKAPQFKTAAAAGSRVVYCMAHQKDKTEVYLKDAASGKSWKLNPDEKLYSYLFISKNQKTAVIANIEVRANRMSYYYATEKDDFKIKPVAALQNQPMNQLRLAAFGKAYVTFNGNEIYWGKLE